MMKRSFSGIATLILTALLSGGTACPLQGQDAAVVAEDSLMETFRMEGELELRTGENLDSLLNLWYVNQSLESAVDAYSPEGDTLIPDSPVPDFLTPDTLTHQEVNSTGHTP